VRWGNLVECPRLLAEVRTRCYRGELQLYHPVVPAGEEAADVNDQDRRDQATLPSKPYVMDEGQACVGARGV
jgi:hypothetical protein